MLLNRKGQSSLEIALLITAVVAGLVIMQLYFRKGYVGRLKDNADSIGRQFDPQSGYLSAWEDTSDGEITTTENKGAGGPTYTNMEGEEIITHNETETWGEETAFPDGI